MEKINIKGGLIRSTTLTLLRSFMKFDFDLLSIIGTEDYQKTSHLAVKFYFSVKTHFTVSNTKHQHFGKNKKPHSCMQLQYKCCVISTCNLIFLCFIGNYINDLHLKITAYNLQNAKHHYFRKH